MAHQGSLCFKSVWMGAEVERPMEQGLLKGKESASRPISQAQYGGCVLESEAQEYQIALK